MFTVYIGRLGILGTASWSITFEKISVFVYEISYLNFSVTIFSFKK